MIFDFYRYFVFEPVNYEFPDGWGYRVHGMIFVIESY